MAVEPEANNHADAVIVKNSAVKGNRRYNRRKPSAKSPPPPEAKAVQDYKEPAAVVVDDDWGLAGFGRGVDIPGDGAATQWTAGPLVDETPKKITEDDRVIRAAAPPSSQPLVVDRVRPSSEVTGNGEGDAETGSRRRGRRRRGRRHGQGHESPKAGPATRKDAVKDSPSVAASEPVKAASTKESAPEASARSTGRPSRGRSRRSTRPEPTVPAPAPAVPRPSDQEYDDAFAGADTAAKEESALTIVTARTIPKTGRQMIVNSSSADECRIAILQDGKLEELFLERLSSESHVGNIYKGRVLNVEPSIQAAFVDFGLPKNGFLHITDVQPQYFRDGRNEPESVGRKVPRRDRPPIQKCLFRGQEVIVQITKEGVGTKGPTLTTYLSIPGRYLVLMPGMQRLGVSRKIEDEAMRRTMRELLEEMKLPDDMGFILRTAGLDRTKRELQRDLNYLLRLWKIVAERIRSQRAPCDLYQESDLVIRTIRDAYTTDFDGIVVDDEPTAAKIEEFLRIAMPRSTNKVAYYRDPEPIFQKLGIEEEIDRINARQVPLPSGGSLVIESTEAMVTIDVNSGRFRELNDAEETAYRTNQEAAEEIARQLLLRDLGGLIVCDFIDMRYDRHKREIERALRDALKKHKERARILRMSQFGIIEMTRQRQRPSIRRTIYADCPHCKGSGVVKAQESVVIDTMRIIRMAAQHQQVSRITLTVSPDVASQLQNRKRAELAKLEESTETSIVIRGEPHYAVDQMIYECEDDRGRPVKPHG